MTATQAGPASANALSGGVLGGRPLMARTFGGGDPDTVAAATISSQTPTKCQARTRLYRDGTLEREGFPVSQISDYLPDESVTIWLDLRDPDRDDLAVLSGQRLSDRLVELFSSDTALPLPGATGGPRRS